MKLSINYYSHYKSIENFLKRYDLHNTIKNKHPTNKKPVFDKRTERRICRAALKNSWATLTELKEMHHLTASKESLRLCLKRYGIRARHPRKKPALSSEQKDARLN